MQEVIQGNTALINTLAKLCNEGGVRHSSDMSGNAQHWFELRSPSLITAAAAALKDTAARLSLISGYSRASQPDAEEAPSAACYHFVLDNVIYNVTVTLTRKEPAVPSITPTAIQSPSDEPPLFFSFSWSMSVASVMVSGANIRKKRHTAKPVRRSFMAF